MNMTLIMAALVLILLLCVIGAAAYGISRLKRGIRDFSRQVFGTDSLKEGFDRVEEEYQETPKSVSAMTGLYLPKIKKDFPNKNIWCYTGYLYENIVAQCLASNGNELFYHTIMNENSKHNYEIDFILAKKNKIIPLEVKSSGYKTHKSLDVFTEKFSDRILNRYLVYTKDMEKDKDIFCLPVYMVPFL